MGTQFTQNSTFKHALIVYEMTDRHNLLDLNKHFLLVFRQWSMQSNNIDIMFLQTRVWYNDRKLSKQE